MAPPTIAPAKAKGKPKATPSSKTTKASKAKVTKSTASKTARNPGLTATGRRKKFSNILTEETLKFLWTCLTDVSVDYRHVAGILGITYSACNQRYYSIRDYFKACEEEKNKAENPDETATPTGASTSDKKKTTAKTKTGRKPPAKREPKKAKQGKANTADKTTESVPDDAPAEEHSSIPTPESQEYVVVCHPDAVDDTAMQTEADNEAQAPQLERDESVDTITEVEDA